MARPNNTASGLAQRSRMPLVILAIILAVVLLAAFMSLRKADMPVRIGHAERAPITASISTNGKVEPVKNFEAHAPGSAIVKRVLVREGDRVKAGQLLVQLDDAEARASAARAMAQLRNAEADLFAIQKGGTHEEVLTTQSQLAKAQTELDAAQRNYEALQRLQKTGAASPAEAQEAKNRLQRAQADAELLQQKQQQRFSSQDLERAQAQVADARAAYSAAQDVLQNSNITAPQLGTVYSLPVKPGGFVNAGDLLVQVADLSTVVVRAFVDEPDIGRLRKGQQVEVTWDAIPGRTWVGDVISVPTTVRLNGTRTVGEVTCEVNNEDLKLLPNVNVSVGVITARDVNALTLPREAVHQDDGHTFVYQVLDGKLQRTDIHTSISNLTRIEVTSGLNDGADVALSSMNGQPLRPGQPVRVVTP
jgi:HlyD family secretion protein